MMSMFRCTNASSRMCSMFRSDPVSRLSTQITRWPRCSSSSHRWEPRKPAPPVTRLVGIRRECTDSARGMLDAPAQNVLVAAADGHLRGVEMLEQRLGEFARRAELVAQLCERDRAAGSLCQRHEAPQDVL